MNVAFTDKGGEDYTSWEDDRKILKRVNRLIKEARREPAVGAGKPERLSGDLSAYWSRRIDQEHRLVYTVRANQLVVIAVRYHY